MNMFYVYSSAKDELEFVESTSMEGFAAHEFDPTTTAFTGIAIEADDLNDALQIYLNPACGFGEYILSDEPVETQTRRQIANSNTELQQSFDRVKTRLEYLRICLKMKAARFKMEEANRLMNEASHDLFKLHNKPEDNQPEVIFEKIASATIEVCIKYNGDTKQS